MDFEGFDGTLSQVKGVLMRLSGLVVGLRGNGAGHSLGDSTSIVVVAK